MAKSVAESLRTCVRPADGVALSNAREVCVRIQERVRYLDSSGAGRIVAAAGHAEDALFDLLNYALNHGGCEEAGRAMDDYDRLRNDRLSRR